MALKPMLAARIFGTPLLVSASKLDAILGVLGPRMGLDIPSPGPGPESEAKTREALALAGDVAVIQVVGTLAHRVDSLDAMSGMSSYETLAAEIDRAAADPAVGGILLEVDSFGGECAGCFDLADRIAKAREAKPVFGVANQYAMSAGYALLSQCDQVFVPQSGEVGSIGVVTTHMDVSAAAAQQGVRVTHVYAGARKVDLSPFKALSDEARARLEADVAQLYDQFTGLVGRGRGERLSADQAKTTEALTFIGSKAVEAGLADHVGDKAAAHAALAAKVEDRRMDKQLAEKAAKLEAQNAALTLENDRLKKAEAERQAADDKAFLEGLKKQSADAQNPIPAARLAQVQAHLDAGRRDVARELGGALLEVALVKKGEPTKTTPAAPPPAGDREAAIARGKERLAKRAGTNKNTKR